jgi:predicted TIM-barrel fold metal-dependent hydrolase
MKRIDVHCHFVPDFYRAELEAYGLRRPDGIASIPQWSAADALSTMDLLGVETAFLSISSPGVHFGEDMAARALARRVNEEGAHLTKLHKGRFGFFASTPLPDSEGAVLEARYALDELGADGVILETNFHGVYLGNERIDPLYTELNARRTVVFVHPTSPHCPCCSNDRQDEAANSAALGYPRPMLEFIFETTRTVTNMVLSGVLERYPDMKVIVPHAGAALPVLAGRVELLLPMLTAPGAARPPSLRAALRKMHFDLAGTPVPELLGALLHVADPEQIHYGSDFPFTPAHVCEALLSQLNETPILNAELKQRIMSGNARRLFPRLSR